VPAIVAALTVPIKKPSCAEAALRKPCDLRKSIVYPDWIFAPVEEIAEAVLALAG
jgi:hypothetical protein